MKEKKFEVMTTKKCRARKCDDLVLEPGQFGYRCRLTGEIPRFNENGCPKDRAREAGDIPLKNYGPLIGGMTGKGP
jgi:hypothetical protein